MIIGFGSAESAFENDEERAIVAYVREAYARLGCDYVTPELEKDVRDWVSMRATEYRQKDADYKTALEFPDRYSSYWTRVITGASDVFVVMSFVHTNRRHGMSPDGWACLQTKRIVHIDDFK